MGQHPVNYPQHFPGKGDSGTLFAVLPRDPVVVVPQGGVAAVGDQRALHHYPAQPLRALFGYPSVEDLSSAAQSGRNKPGIAAQVPGVREPGNVTDLARYEKGGVVPDTGNRHEECSVLVLRYLNLDSLINLPHERRQTVVQSECSRYRAGGRSRRTRTGGQVYVRAESVSMAGFCMRLFSSTSGAYSDKMYYQVRSWRCEFMNGRGHMSSGVRLTVVTILAVSIFLLGLGALSSGCGGSSEQALADQYKKQWTDIMNAFQTRVLADDKKTTALINENDAAGAIKLVNQRIANIDEVTGKILALRPPKDLRKVHAITLYYLSSLKDQFKDTNEFYNAVLTGLPSKDLKTIMDQAAYKTRAIGAELGVELQKLDMELKTAGEKPKSQQSATQSANQ